MQKYRILLFLVFTCVASFSQNQICFRQLSIKEGLFQNSMVRSNEKILNMKHDEAKITPLMDKKTICPMFLP
ncbi:hypothetical protein BWZ22_12405 [Seonamhaeicola sp. S2-3]|nr:hypothetical protein BWZ22_12405 [Seonamhaeicola sp. S2-3]